jgi:large subunit ribosomal protein L18
LVAHRSGRHIYAQLITPDAKVVASASTAEKEVRGKFANGNTAAAAVAVGERIAQKAKKAKLDPKVVFDRSGFKYHGRIKALADGARSGGLEF